MENKKGMGNTGILSYDLEVLNTVFYQLFYGSIICYLLGVKLYFVGSF